MVKHRVHNSIGELFAKSSPTKSETLVRDFFQSKSTVVHMCDIAKVSISRYRCDITNVMNYYLIYATNITIFP